MKEQSDKLVAHGRQGCALCHDVVWDNLKKINPKRDLFICPGCNRMIDQPCLDRLLVAAKAIVKPCEDMLESDPSGHVHGMTLIRQAESAIEELQKAIKEVPE